MTEVEELRAQLWAEAERRIDADLGFDAAWSLWQAAEDRAVEAWAASGADRYEKLYSNERTARLAAERRLAGAHAAIEALGHEHVEAGTVKALRTALLEQLGAQTLDGECVWPEGSRGRARWTEANELVRSTR